MYAHGYTVILPEQRGQGMSEGRRGDYTAADLVQNIVDVSRWARQRYDGRPFMGGGGLSYYAAAKRG